LPKPNPIHTSTRKTTQNKHPTSLNRQRGSKKRSPPNIPEAEPAQNGLLTKHILNVSGNLFKSNTVSLSKILPPHQNLRENSGSESLTRLGYEATSRASDIRRPETFLVVSFTLIGEPLGRTRGKKSVFRTLRFTTPIPAKSQQHPAAIR
jgi:hypothetical protein